MGADQSRTRKLTVENDPTSVIKVSEDVVQRLRNRQAAATTNIEQQSSQQIPVAPPHPHVYGPSVTSLQLRQTHLAELKKNDQYWKERLRNIQDNHSRIDSIIEKECQAAVAELKKQEIKGPVSLPPCDDAKQAVLNCYKQYPNETMRCSNIVEAFQRCVDTQRQRVLSSRG